MLTVAYVFQAFAYDMTLLLFLLMPLTPANPHKGKKPSVLNHHVKNLCTQHVRAWTLIGTP